MIGEVILAMLISNSVAQTPPAQQSPPNMNFGSPQQPQPQPQQQQQQQQQQQPQPQPQQQQQDPNAQNAQAAQPSPAPAPYQSPKLKAAIKEIEALAKQRNKSPFMIPNELYLRIKRKEREKVTENVIDNNADPKVRYPLRSYTLVGILTGMKIPKALIRDRDGRTHIFRPKEFIANNGGYLTEISNGEVIIVEQGSEVKLKIKKEDKN
jgi:Tfp pilus assembly protein PilP